MRARMRTGTHACTHTHTQGNLEISLPRVLYATVPVILVRAVQQDKAEQRDTYLCPVYKTTQRGPTFVFSAHLKTKVPQNTWVLAGVALIMDVGKDPYH